MYNTYVSSTIYPIRSKGSLSHSFFDCPIFLNERCDRNPVHRPSSSSCCSCCVSYAFPTHRVPRGPSILYGSRQSVLLQWSTSRRLILGGGNRFCYRFPEYGCDRDCYEDPCSIKDGRLCRWSDGRRHRRCCMISDSNCEFQTIHQSNGFEGEDIAEEIISLIGEEYFGCQEKIRSSKRVEVGNRGSFGGKERSLSSSKRVEPEKRGRSGTEKIVSTFEKTTVDRRRESHSQRCGGEKNTNKLSSLSSQQNNEGGSLSIESRKDERRLNEGLLIHSRDDSQSLRKGGSSCSSYYSVSSSGDLEDDAEIEDKNVQFVEESQSRYRYDSGSDVGEGSDKQVKEEFKRQGGNERGQEEVSGLDIAVVRACAARHLMKNSEKKFNEASTQVASSVRETSDMNLRLSRTTESDNETTSMSKKKFVDKEEKLNEQSKQYDVSSKRVEGVFINERKEVAESEVSCSNTEVVSCSQKRLIGKDENLEMNANLIEGASNIKKETVGFVLKEKSSRTSTLAQQLVGVSENKKNETRRISNETRQSDAITISRGESTDVAVTSTREIEERCNQTGKHVIGEVDPRKKFLHLGVISVIKDDDISSTGSETRTTNEERNVALVKTSNPVSGDKKSQTYQKASQKILSRKGLQDASNASVVCGTDKLSATQSQEAVEYRSFKEETNKSLVEKTVKETRRRQSQHHDQVVQIELGKEAENRVEKLKVQGSFNFITQSSYQGISVNEEENKSSQAMLMPPPSQLVARDSLHVDSTSKMASQVVSSRTSESSSGALQHRSHRESGADESTGEPVYLITPDSALGSVDRLERSSTQFVGEFIEKSRNELLISEIQKEEKDTEIDLADEDRKYRHKSESNNGSVDNQMKDHDSRHSSRSSGTKGPSDEMWDEIDSSIVQPPKAEDPEISAGSANAIVKRNGRSLWNIISDIVHLRWSSRAETSDSALRSDGRTSPTESVTNETWFSGREHEESNNTKMGRTKTSEFTSSGHLEQRNSSAQTQELSDDRKSKNTYCEVDTSSSLSIMEGKASGGKLVSGEIDLKDGSETTEVISSGLDSEQSSLPLPPQGIRTSPIVEEISHSGKTDTSASSSMEGQLELPRGATSPTTAMKDGELKQRKLQRNKQVLRDRFDEWEEAYILETEQRKIDEMFMREALAEARKAADTWEVPVGAVLVKHGKIIARGFNLVEELRDSTAHAEMICIREASKLLRTWRLAETTLYVTLEPCPMCAGAILQARIDSVVWGAPNKLLGADGSWIRLFPAGGEGNVSDLSDKPAAPVHPFHPKMTIRRGVLVSECADVMKQFFQLRRRKKEKKENTPPLTVAHHPSKFLNKLHNVFHMMFCL